MIPLCSNFLMPLNLHDHYQSDLRAQICIYRATYHFFSSHSSFRKLFPEACRVELTHEMMEKADVDPTLRPTDLSIPQFRALADAYAHICAREPSVRSYEHREELQMNRRNAQTDELMPSRTPDKTSTTVPAKEKRRRRPANSPS